MLSAHNPRTWATVHDSEMKGPVRPDTTCQGPSEAFPGSSAVFLFWRWDQITTRCSAVQCSAAACGRASDVRARAVSRVARWVESCSMHDSLCGPEHDERASGAPGTGPVARHLLPTQVRHPCAHQTQAKCFVPPPMARRNIRGFAIGCSCHFTARPRPPAGRSWLCFGNGPQRPSRYRALEIA